ncbi:MAG: patatin-like phospholipase family protein [Lewinellaceae bacterium]|nr:patatin-like phospholipase family protein [Lewinellaceae bacterium]
MAKKHTPSAPPDAAEAPFDPLNPPDYVERSHQVLAVEREQYLKIRRKKNGLAPPADDNLAGLCISGGGVRSATLGLGLIQALIKKGVLKKFDYLSTVSGGGYIGSCLSSLMSREPNNTEKYSDVPCRNQRFRTEDVGLDENDNPFVGLRYDYEYQTLEKTKLSAKHQLLHLRRYGEYLTPRKGLFAWDVSRAVGALFGGIFIHLLVFLLVLGTVVLVHHALFAALSKGAFIDDLQHPEVVYNEVPGRDTINPRYYEPREEWQRKSAMEQVGAWYHNQLYPQIYLIIRAVEKNPLWAVSFFAFGFLLGRLFIYYSRRLPVRIAEMEQVEAQFTDPKRDKMFERPGGDDLMRFKSWAFVRRFTLAAYLLGPALAYLTAILLAQFGMSDGQDYFMMLALPLSYSFGLFISVHLAISLYYINNAPERVSGRLYRSFYTGMQGATLIGLVVSLLFPLSTILLFGNHGLVIRLLFSFLPVAVAYYFTMQSLSSKSGGNNWLQGMMRQIQTPLLNLSILLFVGMALASVSKVLIDIENLWATDKNDCLEVALWMLLLCGSLTILFGFAANSNDISLHYFYRDRLSEAYLRTEGRVAQPQSVPPEDAPKPVRIQSKELFDVTLRNHENLRLAELGEDNFKGPYHIIVSALNLQGSHDLAKKTLKSDHFIFSKYFIGSRTTGYARTDKYRDGGTKLNTAMAISAAAVASGMGLMSFAASNFYMTLLNLRTGYWLENPWYLHKEAREKELEEKGIKVKRSILERLTQQTRRFPFWLFYLSREFTGLLSANTRRVYVSDGGHTGDNLGMLPLIQRRCSTIVAADFEEDGRFSFGSFNQAVRLAKAIYNTDIEIDLKPLLPAKSEEGLLFSPASVAVGKICYPATRDFPAMEGQIVYMKSSVSLLQEVSDIAPQDAPPPMMEPAPVFVLNYFKNNPSFPHQSTADQYFDEVQFEAYRMLGEHIGKQAAREVKFR